MGFGKKTSKCSSNVDEISYKIEVQPENDCSSEEDECPSSSKSSVEQISPKGSGACCKPGCSVRKPCIGCIKGGCVPQCPRRQTANDQNSKKMRSKSEGRSLRPSKPNQCCDKKKQRSSRKCDDGCKKPEQKKVSLDCGKQKRSKSEGRALKNRPPTPFQSECDMKEKKSDGCDQPPTSCDEDDDEDQCEDENEACGGPSCRIVGCCKQNVKFNDTKTQRCKNFPKVMSRDYSTKGVTKCSNRDKNKQKEPDCGKPKSCDDNQASNNCSDEEEEPSCDKKKCDKSGKGNSDSKCKKSKCSKCNHPSCKGCSTGSSFRDQPCNPCECPEPQMIPMMDSCPCCFANGPPKMSTYFQSYCCRQRNPLNCHEHQ